MTTIPATCHNCQRTITGPARGYWHRGTYRALCQNVQECAEVGVANRLGIPVHIQAAWFSAKARGLVIGSIAELAGVKA